jgi:hypothetical protein
MREFNVKPADELLNRIIQREKEREGRSSPPHTKVNAAQDTSAVNLENNTVFIVHGLE